MELRNPQITVMNTDGGHWQLTADGLIGDASELEWVSFTVLIPRSQESLPELTARGVRRAIELLQDYQQRAKEQPPLPGG